MFIITDTDQISAVVIDGRLYESDRVTPISDAVFVNGVLMREVPIAQAVQAMAMTGTARL